MSNVKKKDNASNRVSRKEKTSSAMKKGSPGKNAVHLSKKDMQTVALLCIVAALAVLFAHWPALSAQALSFDDDQYMVRNPLVQNPGINSAMKFITEVLRPSTVGGYYQPLAMISLMIDYGLGGRPDYLTVFHLTSLVLHIFNTMLILVLLYIIFKNYWAAIITALLFGLHPMTVEAIPWVGERKTLLAAFFALWSLIFYVLYAKKSIKKLFWFSFAAYILALLSKPTSVLLPFAFLLIDYWPLYRLSWSTVKEKIPFYITCAVSAVITYFSQKFTASVVTPGEYSLFRIPLTLCHNIVFYLYKMVVPVNLTSHYPIPEPFTLSHPMLLTGVIGTLALLTGLAFSLRRTRALLCGWLMFFILIFPTMGIIGFTNVITSDKYAYLPSIGLLLLIAWGLGNLFKIMKPVRFRTYAQAGLVLLVVITASAETHAVRNYLGVWENSEKLFRYMISLAPNAAALHNHLGVVLYEKGEEEEAIAEFNESIQLDPDSYASYNSLGIALHMQDRLEDAVSYYRKALEIRPNYAEGHSNLGEALRQQGKIEEAIDELELAIQIKPLYADAYLNLGLAYAASGNLDRSTAVLRQHLALKSGSAQGHLYLGNILVRQGKTDEAIREYRTALAINPELEDAKRNMEAILQNQK